MKRRVMIVVTHLLGSGHLSRALTIGRAFAKEGHEVHVVSGGFPVPHLNSEKIVLHQLPPLRSNGTDFSRLLTPDGESASDVYHQERQKMLEKQRREIQPHLIITELFPFGRRSLKSEFLHLLSGVPKETKTVCSVRDILAPPSKPSKVHFAHDTIAQHYDLLLCHSDPAVCLLDESWPVDEQLSQRLQYTGFVAPASPERVAGQERSGIIVSAGGGAVGDTLLRTAIAAANGDPRHWRLLVAGQDASRRILELQDKATSNVTVEAARPDFRELLGQAQASVNMCGYNTAMDVLQTDVPSVMVPFNEAGEVEQSFRASALSKLDGITVLSEADLTVERLLLSLREVVSQPSRDVTGICFDGAEVTVQKCIGLMDK